MHDFDVIWSRESICDIVDIGDYIESHFGEARANRFYEDIDREGEALGRNFRLFTGTGLYYGEKLIFKKTLGPSILFYYVDDVQRTVYIIRVLRHERDWKEILQAADDYRFD